MRPKQVEYFTRKFQDKMKDSLPSEAAWWIDGIGEITEAEKEAIWNRIESDIDWNGRDRAAENGDFPEWVADAIMEKLTIFKWR